MKQSVTRVNVHLSKAQNEELEFLKQHLGENKSQVVHRAINFLYLYHKDTFFCTEFLGKSTEAKKVNHE